MQFLQTFAGLFANLGNLTWQMVVMWVIGGLLIYLATVSYTHLDVYKRQLVNSLSNGRASKSIAKIWAARAGVSVVKAAIATSTGISRCV